MLTVLEACVEACSIPDRGVRNWALGDAVASSPRETVRGMASSLPVSWGVLVSCWETSRAWAVSEREVTVSWSVHRTLRRAKHLMRPGLTEDEAEELLLAAVTGTVVACVADPHQLARDITFVDGLLNRMVCSARLTPRQASRLRGVLARHVKALERKLE